MKRHRDYRDHLAARKVRRLPPLTELRTVKQAGDVEIVWDRQRREYVKLVHEGIMAQ